MHFSTDVIVGFPGETDEDFAQTLDLFERVGFDMAYIFKYSIRSGTPAAEMEDQCTEVEKELRNRALLSALEKSSRARVAKMVNTVFPVLVEGRGQAQAARPGYVARLTGRTPGNRVTHFDGPDKLIGTVVSVRIERATTSSLYGEVVTV
jgi:tRNA-2-methylthio-N6-dimethylallyladenosine synthase